MTEQTVLMKPVSNKFWEQSESTNLVNMEETNYHYEQNFFLNMSKMFFFCNHPNFYVFWHLNVFYTTTTTVIQLWYGNSVTKFYLFSINLRLYRTCVLDFSASEYLRVSQLFYVQRNILQTAGDGQCITARFDWPTESVPRLSG